MTTTATAAHRTELALAPPAGFRLDPTVRGHGWYDLPPFARAADGTLSFLHTHRHVSGGDVLFAVHVREGAGTGAGTGALALAVETAGPPAPALLAAATAVASDVLVFGADLAPFYAMTDGDPRLGWVRAAGAGRLLRAPTVFEDLTKLICTTNCAWSATRRMVGALVDHLGASGPNGGRAFPTPARMAAEPESFYRAVVRAGYRARALRELAERAAREPEALERLRRLDWPSAHLRRALLALHGVGPYAAEQMLRLLGRYDFLALDSWCLAAFVRLHGRRRPPTRRAIERAYARFGAYRGLAMWLDLTSDWSCHQGQ